MLISKKSHTSQNDHYQKLVICRVNSSSATSVKSSRLVDAFENLPYLGICVDNSQVEMNLYFIVCTKKLHMYSVLVPEE